MVKISHFKSAKDDVKKFETEETPPEKLETEKEPEVVKEWDPTSLPVMPYLYYRLGGAMAWLLGTRPVTLGVLIAILSGVIVQGLDAYPDLSEGTSGKFEFAPSLHLLSQDRISQARL